ncbi:hypothetical protein [Bifidobacterium callimiconis]|uniref:Uncharacterized protein n=1 Tax=Bifidobacterium callimiconis TaxID=2306973 RepID=A0A430FEQ7_9BIFI|nr:hypothetical protein [Bifidobacterium callimiconis]RSX51248.1 hypothetical protein D2E23_1093 [Bifidobacterium callimiconis]
MCDFTNAACGSLNTSKGKGGSGAPSLEKEDLLSRVMGLAVEDDIAGLVHAAYGLALLDALRDCNRASGDVTDGHIATMRRLNESGATGPLAAADWDRAEQRALGASECGTAVRRVLEQRLAMLEHPAGSGVA